MTYAIVWSDESFSAAERFMVDDALGLTAVFDAVDELGDDPRPPAAFAWGGTALLRLRIGRYRVLYKIDDHVIRIEVIHLGRS